MNRFLFAAIGFGLLAGGARGQGVDYDHEIQQIAARPEIQKALDLIRELDSRSEPELIELTEIPAPPFKERERAERVARKLREAGMKDVRIDEVGNVLTRLAGTAGGRTVALVAHLDTVFPEGTDVTVHRKGYRLLAPGIGDDTRGLVLLLEVVRAMVQSGVKTRDDVLFVASVGEEGLGDLRGVKHLFRKGAPAIDELIAIDGGSTERVLNQAIGSHRYRITFKGPGGHSWGAFGLGNPAHALARAITYFDDEASELVIGGPKTTYNVGRIGGGTSVNAIPFENWAEVDLRSEDPEHLEKIDAILHQAVQRALADENQLSRRGPALTVDVELIGDRPSGAIGPENPLIQRAFAATRFVGAEPELEAGSTDSNVPISLGIPATTIGRGGDGEGAHSLHEWWSNRDGYRDVQKALLLVVASAGAAPVK